MKKDTLKLFPVSVYCEGRTADGQILKFTCAPEHKLEVKDFLQTKICSLSIPTSHMVFGGQDGKSVQYTRYDIMQHKHAGGGEGGVGGYIEVLEIKNAPDGRAGIVINEYNTSEGSTFTEWETLESACEAFEKFWDSSDATKKFQGLPGFKRSVTCGALRPWFWAIGDEELIGDYAFPEGLQDDPVYRFGKKFVVFGRDCLPSVKTCMGTRFILETEPRLYRSATYRLIYFDDGSVWDEKNPPYLRGSEECCPPRLLEEKEMWVIEALSEFRKMLAGKKTDFSINFLDGTKFVGKVVGEKKKATCLAGDYYLAVHIKGVNKPREGWVNNFKPTPECPDIISYVMATFKERGQEVERIELKERKLKLGGKKWAGAFFDKDLSRISNTIK